MGQPRAGKRVVVISSDEEEDSSANHEEDIFTDEELSKPKSVTSAKATGGVLVAQGKQKAASKNTKPDSTSPSSSAQARSKAPVKADVKKGKGTIFSFFNAATQKQQSSQHQASPPRPKESTQSEQIIDDVEGDTSTVPFAKGSQIALASRKRKLKHGDQLQGGDGFAIPSNTQKFLKTSEGTRVASRPSTEDKRPWTEQYGPNDLSELAVHKKKLSDVRALLEEAISERGRPRLIVLKGSAGTGKTATIKLLAKELDLELLEWRNTAGADMDSDGFVSASAQFEDFILRSGKFIGLDLVSESGTKLYNQTAKRSADTMTSGSRSQVILIEEFPNTFSKSSNVLLSFRSTIQQHLSARSMPGQTLTPIVMIMSETLLSTNTAAADSFTAHRLLGPNILTHPLTAQCEFNSVAPTILIKALDLVVVKEARKSGRRKTPGAGVLKRLAETGDIRSAVSSLEFLCLRGDSEPENWSSKVAFTKPKTKPREASLTKQEEEALKLISNRESTLGIFHAVGKVMYNKRLPATSADYPHPPKHLPQHRRSKVPETDVDSLLMELGTDTATFVAALHENFTQSCSSNSSEESLEALNGCIDALSEADILAPDRFGASGRTYSGSAGDSLRQDDMSFQTAVRGVLFALPYPVSRSLNSGPKKGDAHRMFYPTSLKIWKKREELESVLETIVQDVANISHGFTAKKRSGGGVEGWKRNENGPTLTAAVDVTDDDGAGGAGAARAFLGSANRVEMLLERLPYIAAIFDHRDDISSLVRERMTSLVSFDGLDLGPDAADDDALLDDDRAVDWTVEHPDEERSVRTSVRSKRTERGKVKIEREGGGLNIPVEHAVERLVLSDDDIED